MRPIKQLTHQQIKNQRRQFPVVVVCQDVSGPFNIGAVFRLADAMGVEKIFLCGQSPEPPHRKITKTARSTDQFVPYIYHSSTRETLSDLKKEGYQLVGLEITDQSRPLTDIEFRGMGAIALIIGAENQGMLPDTLQLLDVAVHIPMYGRNTSMNVVQACAIALYEITRQLSLP